MTPYAKSFQPYFIPVDDRTITVSASAQRVNIPLAERLPPFIRDHVAHLIGWSLDIVYTPTLTTAPTIQDLNSVISQFLYRAESNRVAVDQSGRDLRAMEAYCNGGKLLNPDPDTNSGSGNTFNWGRYVSMAPLGFQGSPDDFALPNALLSASSIEYLIGVLTDPSADVTAATLRLVLSAVCIGLDEVRIPPKVQRKNWPGSGNRLEIGERSLLTSMVMCNSSTHDAITAGDFATIKVDDRRGNVFNGQPVATLGRMYDSLMGAGQFGPIQGEPRAATDDNKKIVNGGTPTALVNPTAAYQPVLWSMPGSRIDKVEVEMPGAVQWSGSQTTAHVITEQLLPRGEDEVRDLAHQAFQRMKLTMRGGAIKSGSGRLYKGPRAEYMPWAFQYR